MDEILQVEEENKNVILSRDVESKDVYEAGPNIAITPKTHEIAPDVEVTTYEISGKDWTNDIQSAVSGKQDKLEFGYKRRTISVESEGQKFNINNVNVRESLTVNLVQRNLTADDTYIYLSEDCDDALILLNAPHGDEAESIYCYRNNTLLTNIYQITPTFSDVNYIIQSTREDGSGMGIPTDWNETKLTYADKSDGYDKLYNRDLRNVTKVLVKIVADYAFIYPIEFNAQ